MSRGLRPGDLLSPYLFVLCIERLGHYINYAVDKGIWKPIGLKRTGPKISHIFFADDLLIFVEAFLNQVQIVKNYLQVFCDCSGQKVNSDKTEVFFSKIVNHVQAQ